MRVRTPMNKRQLCLIDKCCGALDDHLGSPNGKFGPALPTHHT
ncbi:hypothetical protein AVEN_242707-1, partial [Araneus ventricosus]